MFHVEGTVGLARTREVVAGGKQILRTCVPIDFAQCGRRVIVASDGSVLVGVLEFGGKEGDEAGIDPVRVVLLGLREKLLIEGDEVEQLVFLDGPAKSAAE